MNRSIHLLTMCILNCVSLHLTYQGIAFILILFIAESKQGLRERHLLNRLLRNYDPLERPVALETQALNVTFGLTLQQIIDVDEKNQILTTNAWLNLEWTDYNLVWDAGEYGGIKDLRITPKNIWRPDILMYNRSVLDENMTRQSVYLFLTDSADEKFDGTFHTNVVVKHDGNCLYIPPGIFKSTCKIDITWFPFDDQHCDMKFGSWTYDGFQLDLVLKSTEGGDLSNFITNGEWYLLGMPGKKNIVTYQCCPEPYIDITFTVQIRRRTLYYFFNLIVPCVLISSMALLGFTLPPDSGEKLTLGVTILLSLTVFLNLVAESMPTTSDAVPLIGTYFNCIMFMVASSVVLTVVVLNYHHRTSDNYDMPYWIRRIFLQWMPWILLMSRPGKKISLKTILHGDQQTKKTELKDRLSKSLLANVLNIEDDFRLYSGVSSANAGDSIYLHHQEASAAAAATTTTANISHVAAGADDSVVCSFPQKELHAILMEVQYITNKIRKAEEEAEIISDWKFAAIVMDRFCLIIFTMFTIIATLVVLLSAPHIIVQ